MTYEEKRLRRLAIGTFAFYRPDLAEKEIARIFSISQQQVSICLTEAKEQIYGITNTKSRRNARNAGDIQRPQGPSLG